MRSRDLLALAAGTAGAAWGARTLVRGMLHGVDDLRLDAVTLPLSRWPESLRGTRIAVLADLHVGGEYSLRRARRAAELAASQKPDAVALVGDFVNLWQPDSEAWLREALEPLRDLGGAAFAIPGNHDYHRGDPARLEPVFQGLGIQLLRNASMKLGGITWVGVDSAVEKEARPAQAMRGVEGPAVVLWHEPDLVESLPPGGALMLSGHAHGGQGRLLGRYTPVRTKLGRRYVDGFYPDAPTPLYVSRGVGTTLFPFRHDVPPEVSLLTLIPLSPPGRSAEGGDDTA